jgi:hypothetical protein
MTTNGRRERDRIPPHDLDAEASLLGALLIAPSGWATINGLAPGDFHKVAHQDVYTAMLAMRARGEVPDIVTVAAELRSKGAFDGAVETMLMELQAAPPATVNVARYADMVRETARRRQAVILSAGLADLAFDSSQNLETGLARCVDEIDQLRRAATTTGARFRRWSVGELLGADLTFRWDATGLLVRPTYGVDSGELKTLKTHFAVARIVGLAAGVPILGRWTVPQRLRVLAYVAEGGRIPFTRLLSRMCDAHGVDIHDLDGWLETVYDAGPIDQREFRDSLIGHLDDFKPAFTHLDPLYPFQPTSVSSNQLSQVGAMLNKVQAICAQRESTLWVTAHMNQTGTGHDLKRITGAGVGEWGDSWVLLRHRATPDVAAGRFRLAVDIGSRQWGGAAFEVDFDLGRFDSELERYDEPIRFHVSAAHSGELIDQDAAKRVKARKAVMETMRRAQRPLTRTEIEERTIGTAKTVIRAEVAVMIDQGELVEHGVRKPEKGGRATPLYVLAETWSDA